MISKIGICFVGPMLGSNPGWVPNPSQELAPRLAARGYRYCLASQHLSRSQRFADILATIYRQSEGIDILCLQVYGFLSFIAEDAASWLGRRLGQRVIMTLHGGDMPRFMARHPSWTRRVLRRAHRIVTPSNYLAKAVRAYGFQAQVIPNAIDLQNYPFRLRRALRPRLLWMRTFHDVYNPMLAVEVMAKLKPLYKQATLTMAGQEKGQLEAVQARVRELGLGKDIHFVGFLDTQGKQRYFTDHDIFLNTNRVDNMPVSVVEAAAFGLPIVATRVGGIPDLLTHGHNALLVKDDDIEDMLAAVLRLLSEPELSERLSNNARSLAEGYDWSSVLPQWERVFREVMEMR